MKRLELFQFLRNEKLLRGGASQRAIKELIKYIIGKKEEYSDIIKKDSEIFKKTKIFLSNLSTRWKCCKFDINTFKHKYSDWLNKEFQCKIYIPYISEQETSTRKLGRPTTSFTDSSRKSKRIKIQPLLEKTPEELSLATAAAYHSSGQRDIASVIKKVTTSSPRSVKRIKKAALNTSTAIQPYTLNEALALIVNLKLTRHQYIILRQGAKTRNVNLYPPYYAVIKAKTECYPANDKIMITDTTVDINLQSLLDVTTQRLFMIQEEVMMQTFSENTENLLEMTYKWGTDGSSGHSLYKQSFQDSKNTDADIIQSSLVPLQLNFHDSERNLILWQNPRTSSTRFCRPIRFVFAKESDQVENEVSHIERQIEKLEPTTLIINGRKFIVKHNLCQTMVDGKVCNALTSTSSAQVCYICRVTPKYVNNLTSVLQRTPDTSTFKFGLSVLHAKIRFMECLLHIAYRIHLKKWRVSKDSIAEKKKVITDAFKQEMGLLIDVVIQGKGSTNDGNTARRFFASPGKVAEITGLDKTLILRFATILDVISSGYTINSDAFRRYTLDTAEMYVKLYDWYPMPVSVHKILIHGADVLNSMMCPIGQLSEDALEARHKEYRKFRESNTRKMSRIKCNEDLLHTLLISSDPVISSIRPLPQKKKSSLSKAVISLLEMPKIDKI